MGMSVVRGNASLGWRMRFGDGWRVMSVTGAVRCGQREAGRYPGQWGDQDDEDSRGVLKLKLRPESTGRGLCNRDPPRLALNIDVSRGARGYIL